jgi:Asp-tRNA(Asn)/Glu-tRNA(Gln) amidotransferase A subunit family amidase
LTWPIVGFFAAASFASRHRAAQDATAVARLRAAGAIVGKTNCPEFLWNYRDR